MQDEEMTANGQDSWVDRDFAWGLGLLPAALGGFVALSFVAALAVPVVKVARDGQFAGWWAGALYLIAVGVAAWLLKKTDRWPEDRVAWGLIGLGVLAKTIVALLVPRLPFNIDQSLFHHFAVQLAADGYSGTALAALSEFYDYPLWAGRIFPVHYLIERLVGAHAWACLKMLNVLAASLILCLTYAFARRILPSGARKWAVFLLLALPFQTFWVTDYSHHLYSSLYLLVFAWAARELAFGTGGIIRRLGWSVLAAGCLLCMAWQGGVDWIAVGMAAALVVLHYWTRRNVRQTALLAVLLLAVPVGAATALKGPLLMDRIRACDAQRQNSVLPAFMARGWCPGTGGEYNPLYEKLDRATPWPEKPKAMFRLVASQIRHAPLETCFGLPCVKTAKLFLVGYASNLEESLALERSPALPAVGWARRAGTAFFLLAVLLGCVRLAGGKGSLVQWTPVLLVPLLTWGAYVLAGETSPRYSVFCQPFLAVVGALAFQRGGMTGPSVRTWLFRTAAVALVLLAAAACVAGAVHLAPGGFYEDLRGGWGGEATRDGPNPLFERTVVLPAGAESVAMPWPVPEGAVGCSFYPLRCQGNMAGAAVEISLPDGSPLAAFPVDGRRLPVYEEVSVPGGVRELRVTVSREASASQEEGALVFGYLLWKVP